MVWHLSKGAVSYNTRNPVGKKHPPSRFLGTAQNIGRGKNMLVEFSIIPLGKNSSIGDDIAKVLKIVDNSGLPYKLNPMGTVVEGRWDEVMALINTCHQAVLRGGERVITSIKIDDRKKHHNMIEGKVKSIEKRLRKSLRK